MSLSTQPYRGTRDFYPLDFLKRQYIFDTWTKVLRGLGYQQYDAPILEEAELYIQKSGEELGNKQLYHFYDKGERHIALRPEMTPSLARMVAAKFGELKFPLKWFSIPNCFRYERPQKGRLREFWQLNVDVIGLPAGPIDLEFLYMITQLFAGFGAKPEQFQIKFNHRGVLDRWLQYQKLESYKSTIYAVLDDWYKTDEEVKTATLKEAGLSQSQITAVLKLNQDRTYQEIAYEFAELRLILVNLGTIFQDVQITFDPTIVRGLAYYTGLVFEAFDTNPNNSRALLGGGRYDDLLDLFGKQAPAIGLGWGDATMANFLDNWQLWPADLHSSAGVKVGLLPNSDQDLIKIYTEILPQLRANNQAFEIDYDYQRNLKKRYSSLKKRGCQEIIQF